MGTLKVSKILNANTTDGGIEIDSTGHVQVDGVQMPTAGQLSNRNLIINGDMRIAQRGTSTTTSGTFAIDRFVCGFSNLSITTSQETLSSGDPHDEGFRYFTRMTNSAASSATSTFVQLDYKVEAQDMATCGWDYTNTNSYISVQFWARSSLAGQYYIQLRAVDGGEDYWNHPYNLTANTWTKVEFKVPGNAIVTFNNDNGTGLFISIPPHYGTDFTGSTAQENAWFTRSGNDWYPDFDQDWGNTTGTFDITGLQVEVGEKPTPFEHRSYGDELARCQRYYYRWTSGTAGRYLCMLQSFSSSQAFGIIKALPVTMRAVPTSTVSGTFTPFDDNGTFAGHSAFTSTVMNQNTVNDLATNGWGGASGIDGGGRAVVLLVTEADAFVDASAEL